MKEKLLYIIKYPKTKYVIALVLFFLLMTLSREKNIFYYLNIKKQKKELELRKKYYMEEIIKDSLNTAIIQKDLDAAEKFGREKYLMKKENEDIFIIRHANDSMIQNTIE
ncbi:MAG: septum formation inhibitor [Bacteroidales bacterium]